MASNVLCVILISSLTLTLYIPVNGKSPLSVDAHAVDLDSTEMGSGGKEETPYQEMSRLIGNPLNMAAVSELLKELQEAAGCRDSKKGFCGECFSAEKIWKFANVSEDIINLTEYQRIAHIILYLIMGNMEQSCTTGIITEEQLNHELFLDNSSCNAKVDNIIEGVKEEFCPMAFQCITPLDKWTDLGIENCNLDYQVTSKIFLDLLKCDCSLPDKEFFLEEIFDNFEYRNESLTLEGFENLLSRLKIGNEIHAEEDDHEHKRKKRGAEVAEDEYYDTEQCYGAEDLLKIHGIEDISKKNFKELCPSLIQQVVTGACKSEESTVTNKDPTYTLTKVYGYGTAAVVLITMLALIGLLTFPTIKTAGYKLAMQFFIALGVGTMSGDALMHLIPEVLELHNHEEVSSGHDPEQEEDNSYIWRLLTVIGGVYLFFIFETSIRLWNKTRNGKISFHSHSHDSDEHGMSSHGNHDGNHTSSAMDDCNNVKKNMKESDPGGLCGNISSIALMVFIGDVLHNFGDGIAIGVAFSSSWVSGLATSIAVFCHELPHEFADFAIYLKNGLSRWKALAANFTAGCTALIGLYIGINLAEDPEMRQWLLCVIAGMFLYIALVDLIHEMLDEETTQPIVQFILQNMGLVCGWTILLVIGLFESDIASGIAN